MLSTCIPRSARLQRSAWLLPALAALLLVLPACDSNDPIADPAEVAGTYTLQELVYDPANENLGSIDLRSTRFQGTVRLELVSGGDFSLRYQPQGGEERILTGNFTVTEDEVRFDGESDQASEYHRFLLEDDFTLDRTSNGLTGRISRTVNNSRYPDFYTGVGEVQGTLRIDFDR